MQVGLDADVLAWFKTYGKGYQSRINAVLRDVMLQNMQGQV
ncbi:MAG: BrnA antitoxin family protein [Tannerellaceae bacterium]|nr:BrnA antitoxin family protein [Tannerellaceae bacterium]